MKAIANIDVNLFLGMDAHVFWMDSEFTFQGCNDVVANYWRLDHPKDIQSKKHSYLAKVRNMELQCQSFLRNNHQVLQKERPLLNILEPIVPDDNGPGYYKTNLFPLKNKLDEVIGVFGITSAIDAVLPSTPKHSLINRITYDLKFASLTVKEREVLVWLAMGCTIKIIATQLQISSRTVETHVENLKLKLNATSKTALAMLCFDHLPYDEILV